MSVVEAIKFELIFILLLIWLNDWQYFISPWRN